MDTVAGRESRGGRRSGKRLPASSQWVDLDGPVHYLDFGGPSGGPRVICVHGLGGSAVNWAAVGPVLAESCRVWALDLPGFGRTVGGGRPPTVRANQQVLNRFINEVVGPPVILVGNSMGGLISVLQADACPETVSGLVLVDPALPVGARARPHPLVALLFALYAVPAFGRVVMERRRAIRSVEDQVMDVLRLCCADASRVPSEIVAAHLEVARERHASPDIDAELVIAARSLMWVLARRREHAKMLQRISVPVLLLHGDRDRLVPIAAARDAAAANPLWQFEIAHGVGHVPQLEAPDWTIAQILGWLATDGSTAKLAAT